MSGIVEAVGEGVAGFATGDEVYARISSGTYAEFVTAPAQFFSRKPSNLSFSQAAAIPVAGLTAYECVFGKFRISPAQPVLIAGASGGVGSLAVQMLRHLGAGPIIATAGSPKSAGYLTNHLGIDPDRVLFYNDSTVTELAHEIKEMCGGTGVDAAFDFVGGEMKRLCFECVRAAGRVVSVVEEPADFSLNLWDETTSPLIMKSLSFHFVQLAARAIHGNKEDWKFYGESLNELRRLLETGILKAPQLLKVGEMSVETVQKAHAMLETRHTTGKLVMSVGK
jgi:NADPH:quinone reductase-like Zn-dependent oxidoreductase